MLAVRRLANTWDNSTEGADNICVSRLTRCSMSHESVRIKNQASRSAHHTKLTGEFQPLLSINFNKSDATDVVDDSVEDAEDLTVGGLLVGVRGVTRGQGGEQGQQPGGAAEVGRSGGGHFSSVVAGSASDPS